MINTVYNKYRLCKILLIILYIYIICHRGNRFEIRPVGACLISNLHWYKYSDVLPNRYREPL